VSDSLLISCSRYISMDVITSNDNKSKTMQVSNKRSIHDKVHK
jgi:hypothetical protein